MREMRVQFIRHILFFMHLQGGKYSRVRVIHILCCRSSAIDQDSISIKYLELLPTFRRIIYIHRAQENSSLKKVELELPIVDSCRGDETRTLRRRRRGRGCCRGRGGRGGHGGRGRGGQVPGRRTPRQLPAGNTFAILQKKWDAISQSAITRPHPSAFQVRFPQEYTDVSRRN